MATIAQPAKKSYFFEKGYQDLRNTIKGAWQRNWLSILTYKDKIALIQWDDGKFMGFLKLVAYILAIVAVLVCGSIITIGISAINIAILVIFMAIVYVGFTLIWTADRIYLFQKKISAPCTECKEKSLIPHYICPKCGAKHTNLTPGVYGILHRTCIGEDPNSYCGESLPTTFFNGRSKLEAKCPVCSTDSKEAVSICIPIVGGRSVGKTAFITAFSRDFIQQVAPQKNWSVEFYNQAKADIYKEINQDYLNGSTRMTDRPQDVNKTSSVSFSFFVRGTQFKPQRAVHVYDIAGEVFTDNTENEIQKQYQYCQGIALIIDPFAIPDVRYRLESQLAPEDIAGIGNADINGVIDSFLNKLREVTGLSDNSMSKVPLAVIISKIDSAGLAQEIGEPAVKNLMATDPSKYNNAQDVQDYLCRKFLKDNGMDAFLRNIDIKFKNNRFFACTSIGHTRDQGMYQPKGVMEPMEWLFRNADVKMEQSWNDTHFNKTPMLKGVVEMGG